MPITTAPATGASATTTATGTTTETTPAPQAGSGNDNPPPAATGSDNAPPPPASPAPQQQQQQQQLQIGNSSSATRLGRLRPDVLSTTNGIGTVALIAAFVFGIGAWVGMKIQISQGAQNMDLAIWTACADHEAIQDTKLCKKILAKDFSQFEKRDETKAVGTEGVTTSVKVKRGIDGSYADSAIDGSNVDAAIAALVAAGSPSTTIEQSRLSKLLSRISASDRNLINVKPNDGGEPAIRAVVFPLVNLLVKPISWFFEFVEYMLLLVIYCIHKLFSWITIAVIFCIQAWIYSMIEKVLKTVLGTIDYAILSILPSWAPPLLVGDVASLFCLTALRAYWYSTSYYTSLKWALVFRVCIWLLFSAPGASISLWQNMGQVLAQRRQNQWDSQWDSSSSSSSSFATSSSSSVSTLLSQSTTRWFNQKRSEPALPAPAPFSMDAYRSHFLAPNASSESATPQRNPAERPASPAALAPNRPAQDEISPEELFYRHFSSGRGRSPRATSGSRTAMPAPAPAPATKPAPVPVVAGAERRRAGARVEDVIT